MKAPRSSDDGTPPRASAFWFAERDLTCGRGTGCQSPFLVALLLDNAGLGRILEIATGRDKGAPRNECVNRLKASVRPIVSAISASAASRSDVEKMRLRKSIVRSARKFLAQTGEADQIPEQDVASAGTLRNSHLKCAHENLR
jgi:hypothetical protein